MKKILSLKEILSKIILLLNFFILIKSKDQKNKDNLSNHKIINFQDHFEEVILNKAISSIHYCQWEYEDLKVRNNDDVLQLLYFDPLQNPNEKKLSTIDQYFNSTSPKEINKAKIMEKCKEVLFCAIFQIKYSRYKLKVMGKKATEDEVYLFKNKNYQPFNSWQYNCFSLYGKISQRPEGEEFGQNAKYLHEFNNKIHMDNDLYYSHFTKDLYFHKNEIDLKYFFYRQAPKLYLRENIYLPKGKKINFFLNLNPQLHNNIIFSSMVYTDTDYPFLKHPQIIKIPFENSLPDNGDYENFKFENFYFNTGLSSDDQKNLMKKNFNIIEDFENMKVYMPYILINLKFSTKYNKENNRYSYIVNKENLFLKLKKFRENFFKKILFTVEDYRYFYSNDKNFKFFMTAFNKEQKEKDHKKDFLNPEQVNKEENFDKLDLLKYTFFSYGMTYPQLTPNFLNLSKNFFLKFSSSIAYQPKLNKDSTTYGNNLLQTIESDEKKKTIISKSQYQGTCLSFIFYLNVLGEKKSYFPILFVDEFYFLDEKNEKYGNNLKIMIRFNFDNTKGKNFLEFSIVENNGAEVLMDNFELKDFDNSKWNTICIYLSPPHNLDIKDNENTSFFKLDVFLQGYHKEIKWTNKEFKEKWGSSFDYTKHKIRAILKKKKTIDVLKSGVYFADMRVYFNDFNSETQKSDSSKDFFSNGIMLDIFRNDLLINFSNFKEYEELRTGFKQPEIDYNFQIIKIENDDPVDNSNIECLRKWNIDTNIQSNNLFKKDSFFLNSLFENGYPKFKYYGDYFSLEISFSAEFIIKAYNLNNSLVDVENYQKFLTFYISFGILSENIQLNLLNINDVFKYRFTYNEKKTPLKFTFRLNNENYLISLFPKIKSEIIAPDTFNRLLRKEKLNMKTQTFDQSYIYPQLVNFKSYSKSGDMTEEIYLQKLFLNNHLKDNYSNLQNYYVNFKKSFFSIMDSSNHIYQSDFTYSGQPSSKINYFADRFSLKIKGDYSIQISGADFDKKKKEIYLQKLDEKKEIENILIPLIVSQKENNKMRNVINSIEKFKFENDNLLITKRSSNNLINFSITDFKLSLVMYDTDEIYLSIDISNILNLKTKFLVKTDCKNISLEIYLIDVIYNTAIYKIKLINNYKKALRFLDSKAEEDKKNSEIYYSFEADEDKSEEEKNVKVDYFIKILTDDYLMDNYYKSSDFKGNGYENLPFVEEGVTFTILLEKIKTKIIKYGSNNPGSSPPSQTIYQIIFSSLYPLQFLDRTESLNGKSCFVENNEILDRNKYLMRIKNKNEVQIVPSNFSKCIIAMDKRTHLKYLQAPDVEVETNYECTENFIRHVKSDLRDISGKLLEDIKIKISVFETKLFFVFNLNCKGKINVEYEDTYNNNKPLAVEDPEMFYVELKNFKFLKITIGSYFKKFEMENVDIVSPYIINKGNQLDYWGKYYNKEKNYLGVEIKYEVTTYEMIYDKIDMEYSCYMKKFNSGYRINNCFRGIFMIDDNESVPGLSINIHHYNGFALGKYFYLKNMVDRKKIDNNPDDNKNNNKTDPDNNKNNNKTDPDDGKNNNKTDPDDNKNNNKTDPDDGKNNNKTDPDDGKNNNKTDPDDGKNNNKTDPDDGKNNDEKEDKEKDREVELEEKQEYEKENIKKSLTLSNKNILKINKTSLKINSTEFENFKNNSKKFDYLENITNSFDNNNNKNNTKISNSNKMKTIIISNSLIQEINCTSSTCKNSRHKIQTKMTNELEKILNEDSIKNNILNATNPSENILISAMSLFSISADLDLENKNSLKIKNLNKILLDNIPSLVENISSNLNNETIVFNMKNDLMNIVSSTSSNLISQAKLNILNTFQENLIKNNSTKNQTNKDQEIINGFEYNEFYNSSLILTDQNLSIKKMIEENSNTLMKLNLDDFKSGKEINLKTSNFAFKSSKFSNPEENNGINNQTENSEKNKTQRILSILKDHEKFFENSNFSFLNSNENHLNNKLRFLESHKLKISKENYEFINLTNFKTSALIGFPVKYLKNKYGKNLTNFGIIQYSNYPLLSPGNKNFSENVFSINFYNNEQKIIPNISNLTSNIEIYIKKPERSFNTCLFIDHKNNSWNNFGCNGTDMGDILHCSCNHLTDFSLGKFNPIEAINNAVNDIIQLIFDAWIINSLEPFNNLTWGNATVIYIFFSILLIYLIGLKFTMKYDADDKFAGQDKYIFETEIIFGCCSEQQMNSSINEIKENLDKNEQERIMDSIKYFEEKIDNQKLNNILLQKFNLDKIIGQDDIKRNKDSNNPNEQNNNNNNNNTRKNKSIFTNFLNKKRTEKNENKIKEKLIELEEYSRNEKEKEIDDDNKSNNSIDLFDDDNEMDIDEVNNNNNKRNTKTLNDKSPNLEKNLENIRKKTGKISRIPTFDLNINETFESKKSKIDKQNSLVSNTSNSSNNDNNNNNNKDNSEGGKKSFFTNKTFIEGMKNQIKIPTFGVQDFVLGIYNSTDKELQSEILRHFNITKIEKKNIKKDKGDNTNNNNTEVKLSENENDEYEMEESTLDKVKISYDNYKKKLDVITENENDVDNNDNNKEENNNKKKKIKNKKDPEKENIKVELRHNLLYRYFNLLIYFFKNEYQLLNIWLEISKEKTKTAVWTLLIFRLYASLAILAMLNGRGDKENVSSTGYKFHDREIAVSFLTIFLVEIPFMFFENYISRRPVLSNWPEDKIEGERKKAKLYNLLAYLSIFFLNTFGFINTLWISMKFFEKKKEQEFISEFWKETLIDVLFYQIVILLSKTFIFFFLTKNSEKVWWKKTLVTILAAFPWAFAIYG